jgi:hypothetical protein
MAAVITLFQIALVGLVAWMTGRALVTGEVTLNWRVMQRRRNPVGYWLGVAVGCALLYLWGGPLVREMWK